MSKLNTSNTHVPSYQRHWRSKLSILQSLTPDNADYYKQQAERVTEYEMANDYWNAFTCMELKRGTCSSICIHNGESHERKHDFVMRPWNRKYREVKGDFREWDDIGWLSYFVATSTSLHVVQICDGKRSKMNQRRISSFIDALIRNKSIEKLVIDADIGTHNYNKLGALFEHNPNCKLVLADLDNIKMNSAKAIAALLRQSNRGINRIKALALNRSTCTMCNDTVFRTLAPSIRWMTDLQALTMFYNYIGPESAAALGQALETCQHPTLKRFNMRHCTITRGTMNYIVQGLTDCQEITHLEMINIQPGLRSEDLELLASFLSRQHRLQKLDLAECFIGDEGIEALSTSLPHHTSLQYLNLRYNDIRTSLPMLARNICDLPIQQLQLGCNNIDDNGLSSLTEMLTRTSNKTLNILSLSGSDITATGLRTFCPFLQTTGCHLTCLDLYSIPLHDDAIILMADILKNNTSLRYMPFDINELTERAWSAISRTLCNCNSAQDVIMSNHSLRGTDLFVRDQIPREVLELFRMNEEEDTRVTILLKLLYSRCEISPLEPFNFERKYLPLVISFYSRARRTLRCLRWNDYRTITLTKRELKASELGSIFNCMKMHPMTVSMSTTKKRKRYSYDSEQDENDEEEYSTYEDNVSSVDELSNQGTYEDNVSGLPWEEPSYGFL